MVSAFQHLYAKHALRANKNAPEYPLRDVSPFILCGGSGTRLWPLSREAFPSNFIKSLGAETLFQQTCRRLTGDLFGDPSSCQNQQPSLSRSPSNSRRSGIKPAGIVLEPVGRNTAPAACIAALIAARTRSGCARAACALGSHDRRCDGLCRRGRQTASAPRRKAPSSFSASSPTARIPATAISRPSEGKLACSSVQALRGEAVAGGRRSLSRQRRLLLECRHLPVQGGDADRAVKTHAPEILDACRAALDGADRATSAFCVLGDAYARRRPSRSTTPSPRRPATCVCVPLDTPWSDVGSWSALWSLHGKGRRRQCRAGRRRDHPRETQQQLRL